MALSIGVPRHPTRMLRLTIEIEIEMARPWRTTDANLHQHLRHPFR
jgi:hypothetical protein